MMSEMPDTHTGASMAMVSGTVEGDVNVECHTYTGGVKAGKKHVLRNPGIVLVFWGHNYITNPNDVSALVQLISDLVTGPFMNGLVQYGVTRGSIVGQAVVDTDLHNPAPATLDENQAQAQISSCIKAGIITPAPSVNETNLLYFLFPPTTTQLKMNDGSTGFCGYHQHGKFHGNSQNDDLFWAIVDTTGAATATGMTFANKIAFCVSHELAEACTNRDGQGYIADKCEIGDICEASGSVPCCITFQYRGWSVEPYWSNWDNACIQGVQPVSLRTFLRSIGVNANQGLRSLNTPDINLAYMASRE
jgi:hypothetical protein